MTKFLLALLSVNRLEMFKLVFPFFCGLYQKLEKLQEQELIEKPFQRKQMKIRFPERGTSGRSVVTVKNIDFGFEDKVSY